MNSLGNWSIAGILGTGILLGPSGAESELWQCPQADGSLSFNDGGGAGCRDVSALPEVSSTQQPSSPGQVESPSTNAPASGSPSRTIAPVLSSRPFAPTARAIPQLSYRDLPREMKAQGWSMPNHGTISMVHIDLEYWPAGNGPNLAADHHFKEWPRQAFGVAVLAAAKAVKYDPRYVRAQLSMPVGSIVHLRDKVDGPSAGVAWAVAVAAALLGDPLRDDVCLTGTINLDLVVGRVGGVEGKIEGCGLYSRYHEMVVPAGQKTFTLIDKAMARSIKVTEVSTLSEAYEIVTGHPLRSVP